MKAFIPATLLALASATSACTFAYKVSWSGKEPTCFIRVYPENGRHDPAKEDTASESVDISSCNPENDCFSVEDYYTEGAKYDFCVDRKADKKGAIDSDATIQREGGAKHSIKHDGHAEHTKDSVIYWIDSIDCPVQSAGPTPSGT